MANQTKKSHFIQFSSLYKLHFSYILIFTALLFLINESFYSQGYEDKYRWSMRQRMYPIDSIPPDAYTDASEHQALNQSAWGSYYYIENPWISIGPSISGSGAGRVTSARFDPNYHTTNRPYIYITGHNGGVWKSTNAGTSFFPITDALPTISSGVICIDPNNSDILYYATGGSVEGFRYNYYGFGVFKSTDAGETWNGGYNVHYPKVTFSYAIDVNPSNSNVIYLAERTGLFISTDAGETWDASNVYGSCQDVSISIDGQIICAIGGGNDMFWPPTYPGIGYIRSTDYGETFTEMEDYGFTPATRTHISISHADADYVYAVTRSSNIHAYTSTDGGVTFTRHQDLGSNYGLMSADFMFIEASPHDPLVAFLGYGTATTAGLWITTNGGVNWTGMTPPGADQNCFAFNSNVSNEVLIGYDQGLSKSTNLGSSWSSLNSTLVLTESYKLSSYYDANVNLILGAVTDAGFTRSTDGGNSWSVINFGCDGTNVLISQLDPSPYNQKRVVANKGACDLFKFSSNSGVSFTTSDLSGQHDWLAPYFEDPHIAGVFFCALRGFDPHDDKTYINVSTNYGLNWSQTQQGNDLFSPVPTTNPCQMPQTFTMNAVDTNLLFFTSIDYYPEDIGCQREGQMLWRSEDAGETWSLLNRQSGGLPDRYITSVTTDPYDDDIVYVTLSGFESGHVYKSYDRGSNWMNIGGTGSPGLPDVPVNCLEIRNISAWIKELIVGTDNGVYVAIDNENAVPPYNLNWQEYSSGLPRTPVLDVEVNNALGKIRCVAFGRGFYEAPLSGPWVIAGSQNIVKGANDLNINDDIIVSENGILRIPTNSTIRIATGKKILVESGGEIDISNGANVTFTSQSGTWNGIEFQGTGSGTLKNCTFQNTSTPIVIESSGSGETPHPEITINNCTFYAPVDISNRPNVTVSYCNFSYSSGSVPSVLGVASSGSDDVLITNNSITSGSALSSTGISIVYGSNVVVQKNVINNMAVGISISNTSPYVFQNRITNSTASDAVVGIGFDNSYSATVKQNTVIGYQIGYKLYYSSPLMYEDSSYNTNTSGDSVNSLHAVYISNPRLKPDDDGSGLIWDAGKNMLKTTAKGNGIYMYISSIPDIDYGYNEVYGYNNYLFGDGALFVADHYVRCNDWVDDPPNSGKFNLSNPANIIYTPYGCTPPGGSGLSSDLLKDKDKDMNEKMEDNPPQNIIVSYGGGVYDTVKVTSRSFELSMDQQLYGQGVKEELLGNFGAAVTKYKSVIENYQDSTISINAMKKILICHEKMNADSAAYDNLRDYYLNLVQSNPTDTAFIKAAKEQAIKTLVKKGSYSIAISQYEDIVSSSSDPYEILCSELNIIETYMIMIQEGDAPGFTGRLANLKPLNSKDGHKMLLEKLYNLRSSQVISVVPKQFSLSQNYPNPFNPLTKINYSLPNSVKVTIIVYDILGRVVKSLLNEFKEAGAYSVTFDGTGLASGVYFYRIEAGDFVDSKKMVLVK